LKAIIFDLDGTLLNTLDDLADCMNRVLCRHNFHPYPILEYRYFVGEGMRNLVKKTLEPYSKDIQLAEQLFQEMQNEYQNHWNHKTKPYETIEQVLLTLSSEGVILAILTNKPDFLTKEIVRHYFPKIPFLAVQGAQDDFPRKPDPSSALLIIEKTNIQKEEWILIGDSSIDIETAKNASIFPAGVLWGFRSKEELEKTGAKIIFEQPKEIVSFFNLDVRKRV
jgi:phosphoglycolate phosphatase